MKLSNILGSKPKQSKRRKKLTIGLILTGILTISLAFITIYGQYTGTYLIGITGEASRKGIAISSNRDFTDASDKIEFKPVTPLEGVEDILEGVLNIDGAINNDGQFVEVGQQYIAYTFYLKNVGDEAVDVEYSINIIDDYKKIGMATFVKVIEFETNNDDVMLVPLRGINYSKSLLESDSNRIANVIIENFKPGDIKKFTFFVWFDGEYSTKEMMGGAIKLEWVFGILNASGD